MRCLSVHSDRSTLSYKTRTKALRSGNHGPRVRTPADRSRTSAGRTWASTSGSQTSRRPESSSQPRDPDPAPYLGRSPEPSQAPVGAAADPRVRRCHVSHRADLRSPLGQGSGTATCPCGHGCRPPGLVPLHVPQARVFCLKPALLPPGWGVRCQSRASDTHSRVGQA